MISIQDKAPREFIPGSFVGERGESAAPVGSRLSCIPVTGGWTTAEYGAKIASYGNFGMFLLVLVLSVIAGMISERLSEKILKMEEPERPIFLHN